MNGSFEKVLSALREIPIIDAHSHISTTHPHARDISDVLFYHFLRRELYSAGCPDDAYLVSDASLEDRISFFLQYVPYVENTATFWCLRRIFEDVYAVPGGEISLDSCKGACIPRWWCEGWLFWGLSG